METSLHFSTLAPLLLLLFLMLHTLANTPTNITTDQSSLLALKSHITSDPYNLLSNNWTTKTSICCWTGVTCGSTHLTITSLDISNMNLAGTIPPHIGNLTFLNNFTREVPRSWFSSLHRLEVLFLCENELNEVIPDEIRNLRKLKDLRLQNNRFNGPIPAVIFNMSSLELVSLRNNSLSG
ncbi:Non-specific serine/threonine protein kinase [Handroanthus impetiginosus]|uniref:Non-specific serine/threonine protein kinase n=1 Tax=Handroanthus impetiginosus TaxID=429701 RepID=A0A2G9HWH9_9LAMI|nr:Non-specific serine/threonine protein kinase [Handroanthus impetiginosus]